MWWIPVPNVGDQGVSLAAELSSVPTAMELGWRPLRQDHLSCDPRVEDAWVPGCTFPNRVSSAKARDQPSSGRKSRSPFLLVRIIIVSAVDMLLNFSDDVPR